MHMLMAMPEADRIAEGILVQKTRRRLTYQQIADILGMSRQALSNRLNGDTLWKYHELHKLADAWGITIQQLEQGFGDNGGSNAA